MQYRGMQDNDPLNGVLLRTDIHTLYDLNLLGIEPDSLKVVLSTSITADKEYANLNSRTRDRHDSRAETSPWNNDDPSHSDVPPTRINHTDLAPQHDQQDDS